MDPATFEQKRLVLFAAHGFDGESDWITDEAGRKTYLIRRGESHHPTILVHGGLSEAGEWSLMAGDIPGPVVIPDRPGFGLTYKPDYLDVDFRDAAAGWMLNLVDSLDAGQVDLVANSLGGFFSMAFALAHPERVRRLVLVGAPAGLHREIPLVLRLWGNPITGPIIGSQEITDPEDYRDQIFGRIAVAHPEQAPLELLEVMTAATSLPGVDRSAYTLLRNVLTLRGWRRELMLREEMARLPIPTLFLWGDQDAFAPPERGRSVAAEMPEANFEVVEGAGHMAHLDAPGRIAAATNAFLGTAA
jgi:pimeloyl-ACP methyl ester carboxylesterase